MLTLYIRFKSLCSEWPMMKHQTINPTFRTIAGWEGDEPCVEWHRIMSLGYKPMCIGRWAREEEDDAVIYLLSPKELLT